MSAEHGMAIEALQKDVQDIRDDLARLRAFVTGNGDPSKGLLWLAADLSRLLATQTAFSEEHRKRAEQQMAEHKHDDHGERRSGWQERMAYDVAKQVATILVTVALLLLWTGFREQLGV